MVREKASAASLAFQYPGPTRQTKLILGFVVQPHQMIGHGNPDAGSFEVAIHFNNRDANAWFVTVTCHLDKSESFMLA
jgi:hypothetical protein